LAFSRTFGARGPAICRALVNQLSCIDRRNESSNHCESPQRAKAEGRMSRFGPSIQEGRDRPNPSLCAVGFGGVAPLVRRIGGSRGSRSAGVPQPTTSVSELTRLAFRRCEFPVRTSESSSDPRRVDLPSDATPPPTLRPDTRLSRRLYAVSDSSSTLRTASAAAPAMSPAPVALTTAPSPIVTLERFGCRQYSCAIHGLTPSLRASKQANQSRATSKRALVSR
jgi:hypothetical protein